MDEQRRGRPDADRALAGRRGGVRPWREQWLGRRAVRMREVVVAVSVVCLLAGCTSRDVSTPVPTEAAAPYLCDGVPARGVELLTGASAPKVEQIGRWGQD